MTPQTASSLSNVLKETSLMDLKQQARRQMYSAMGTSGKRFWVDPQVGFIDMSPEAVHARQARQDQMVKQLAARKRGNKPSYRQRQKNGRAGRK